MLDADYVRTRCPLCTPFLGSLKVKRVLLDYDHVPMLDYDYLPMLDCDDVPMLDYDHVPMRCSLSSHACHLITDDFVGYYYGIVLFDLIDFGPRDLSTSGAVPSSCLPSSL